MICLEPHIAHFILPFFQENKKTFSNYVKANELIKAVSGINCFFTSKVEAMELSKQLMTYSSTTDETDRREYGDFQTNEELATQITNYAFGIEKGIEFVLEPTCGKGNFIFAALQQSKSLKKVVGVEIYKPYVWETKFKILAHFLAHPDSPKPEIDIIHANAFEFSYKELAKSTKHLKTLVIGNPPWVTNSELSVIESKNLPKKSNFKKHSGLEAMTGKGNFDIAEYIALKMLQCFQNHNGLFAFLIKNSVIKNLIHDQKQNKFSIGQPKMLNIDAKKEFNVSVKAGLFLTHLNTPPSFTCKEMDFYNKEYITVFGWYRNKFVYSVENYDQSSIVDGKSKFIWRSGIKHDCSKVMELQQVNGHYTNRLGETFHLENKLVYGLLKSSDLKNNQTNTFRKLTIITQKKIGQDTQYIKNHFPLTYQYLNTHKDFFEKRKSSIYKNKPPFSIFGIGDYSFAKYKVAISGLYKTTHFTLVQPNKAKPIMLDDTCYFIGFDQLKMAQIAHYLVNTELVQRFLKSIIFSDAKRPITKDILMRIDFGKVFKNFQFKQVQKHIPVLTFGDWAAFGERVKEREREQMRLFE